MGCDHYRKTRLDLVFVLQFTVRKKNFDVVFRPRFPLLLAANKKHLSLFWDLLINKCSLKVAVRHLDLRTEESRNYHLQGFWYFAEKKQNFAGFSGANSRKNQPISRDFRGKKSQNLRKSQPISLEKVKIRGKIGRFCGVLAGKSQISKDFRGKFIEKSADFKGNFRGKLRQETISKKQPISLVFFWQISLKSINFASIWPALFNVI